MLQHIVVVLARVRGPSHLIAPVDADESRLRRPARQAHPIRDGCLALFAARSILERRRKMSAMLLISPAGDVGAFARPASHVSAAVTT
jgi:hypothetical protein